MSFVAAPFKSVVNFVGDVVETAVDFVGNTVESVVNVLSDPFEDPLATALTAAAIYTGYNAWTAPAAGTVAVPGTYQAVAGPMFNPALATTATSTATATAGIAAGAAAGGTSLAFTGGMTGAGLSLSPTSFAGVGSASAAGSMAGSVWASTPTFMEQAVSSVTDPINDIMESPDPVGEIWDKVSDSETGLIKQASDTFYKGQLEKTMANEEGNWIDQLTQPGGWSPTIKYQAGGDPGSATAQAYPSFTRAETGIFGDPFNLEGRDVGLTVNRLANMLQQQQPATFPLPAQAGAFRGAGNPLAQAQQQELLSPSYGVSEFQQPILDQLTAQLGAGAQRRGLEATPSGMAAGIAPQLEQFRRNRLADLGSAAGLDLEGRGQDITGRGQDIQALLGQQDVGTAADVARKNITLNSLLALAQMSKPQIVGGTTSFSDRTGATNPDIGFSGAVPVGNIASAGWNLLEPVASGVGSWIGDLFSDW